MNHTMKSNYLLLFSGRWDDDRGADEVQQILNGVAEWFNRLNEQGVVKGAQALADKRGTLFGGARSVVDGPFAESKEVIGGYLMLETESFDEAMRIAETCPTLQYGVRIEIRPVLEGCPVTERLKQRGRPKQ